jgi:hypothetical protein
MCALHRAAVLVLYSASPSAVSDLSDLSSLSGLITDPALLTVHPNRAFEECVQLPVVRTDDLRCCIYCLQRENLILSPEVLEVIQTSLDNSMHGKSTLQPASANRYARFFCNPC